jgi:hypothetical protein
VLKYRRIAVTALSLTACVLLIALWVRSYMLVDFRRICGHDILVTNGRVFIDPWLITGSGSIFWRGTPDEVDAFSYHPPVSTELRLPFWNLAVVLGAVAALPWYPWWSTRFSLRTLLIATTLVAVVMGIAVMN